MDSIHVFEKAGLGLAPFTFMGCYEDRGPHRTILPGGVELLSGSPGQPMGTCDYCGQSIAICCQIRSADGHEFTVGSDCVAKTGDAGLKRVVSRDISRRRAEQTKVRNVTRIEAAKELLKSHPEIAEALNSQDHPSIPGHTLLDYVEWMFRNAGQSGMVKAARIVENVTKL